MKTSIKEMIEYGYQWPGMIPLSENEVLSGKSKNKPLFVLYPDDTEAMIDSVAPYIGKDYLFGIEREEKEILLIEYAIGELRQLKQNVIKKDSTYEGKYIAWTTVLNLLDFTDEDIDYVIEKALLLED